MSYYEIFVLGWNLNLLMFVSNLLLAFNTFNSKDMALMQKQNTNLRELKNEHEKLYPYRTYETLASYFIPFAAFYRISYRYYEMYMFYKANPNTAMYDFMIYSYQKDINNKS
jgi:hypothetical protein